MPELRRAAPAPAGQTFREIAYEEQGGVGYLYFDFYNGAMSTDQCRRLLDAFRHAAARRETDVIVLMGGRDFFSNGIHLNVIEAAEDPGGESWRNLCAIDDLVREIIETGSHLVISALAGDAGAGGVPLALAADLAVAREDAVLNPYYGHMGGLYGSEYWTYLLPRRVGAEMTVRLTSPPFDAVGTRRAVEIGLLDGAFGDSVEEFEAGVGRSRSGSRTLTGLTGCSTASGPAGLTTSWSSRSRTIVGRSSSARIGASSGLTAATTTLGSRFVHKLPPTVAPPARLVEQAA